MVIRLGVAGAGPDFTDLPHWLGLGVVELAGEASVPTLDGEAEIVITGSLNARPQLATLPGLVTLEGEARILFDAKTTVTLDGEATGAPATYANGYQHREPLLLSAVTDLAADTLVDFPLLLDTSKVPGDWSWLATAAGKLLSISGSTPRDIRFELTDGTRLDHRVVAWNGTLGSAIFRLRLPSWLTSSQLRLQVYYGKAGLGASEENEPGVWRGALAVIHPATGADLTGNGRALTPGAGSAAPSAGTLDGMPAGVFDADAYLRGAALWLNGLPNLTIEGVVQLSSLAEGSYVRAGGTVNNSADAIIFTDDVSFIDGTRTHCWSYGCGRAGSNETSSGPADSLALARQHLHAVYPNGGQVDLYVGEAKLAAAYSLAMPLSGAFAVTSGDNVSIGAGTGTQANAAQGTYLPVIFWPRVLSPTWIAVSARCQLDCGDLVTLGAEETAGDPAASPVMPVVRAAVDVDDLDIDVLSAAYVPSGTASLDAAGPGLHGNASIRSGKVRYRRDAAYAGRDTIPFTGSAGGRSSKGRIIAAVSAASGGPGPGSGEIPSDLTLVTVGYTLQGVPRYDTLAAAVAACPIAGGWHIKLNASGNSYGALVISKLFTSPVVIDVAGGIGSAKGIFTPTGSNIWVRGIDMGNVGNTRRDMAGSKNRWLRCKVSGFTGNETALRDTGTDNFIAYCDFLNCVSALHLDSYVSGGRRSTAHRNFFSGTDGPGNGHESIKMGLAQPGRGINTGNRATFNYFLNCNQDKSVSPSENETIGIKSGGNWVEGNTLIGCVDISKRNGGYPDTIISNWVSDGLGGFDLKDYGGLFAGNYTDNYIGVDAGNTDLSPTATATGFPLARNYKLVGNTGKLRWGLDFRGGGTSNPLAIQNCRMEAHTGAVTYGKHTGTSGTPATPASVPYTPARKMNQSEAGSAAAFTGWTS